MASGPLRAPTRSKVMTWTSLFGAFLLLSVSWSHAGSGSLDLESSTDSNTDSFFQAAETLHLPLASIQSQVLRNFMVGLVRKCSSPDTPHPCFSYLKGFDRREQIREILNSMGPEKCEEEILDSPPFCAQFLNDVLPRLNEAFKALNQVREALSTKKPAEVYCLRLVQAVGALIQHPKNSESLKIRLSRLVDPGWVDLTGFTESTREFLTRFVSEYIGSVDQSILREIFAGQFELPMNPGADPSLLAILNESGPVLHKVLQLIAGQARSASFERFLDQFKSDIKPMSEGELMEVMGRAFKGGTSPYFKSLDLKPAAVASVGQVHFGQARATQLDRGESWVAVKFLRPGARAKAELEFNFLDQNFGQPQDRVVRDLIDNLKESILAEFDFENEKMNLRAAEVYTKVGLRVPELIVEFESIPDVVVMTRAPGKALHKLEKNSKNLCSLGYALSETLKIWFKEAIFGSGYFHADLHSGNLVAEAVTGLRLTLIDFGSAYHLSPSMQKGFLSLMIGVSIRDKKMIKKSIAPLSSGPGGDLSRFESFIDQLDLKAKDPVSLLNEIIVRATETDHLPLTKEFVMFNRGRILLEQQIDNVYRQYFHMKEMAEVRRHSDQALKQIQHVKLWAEDYAKKHLEEEVSRIPFSFYLKMEISSSPLAEVVRSEVKRNTEKRLKKKMDEFSDQLGSSVKYAEDKGIVMESHAAIQECALFKPGDIYSQVLNSKNIRTKFSWVKLFKMRSAFLATFSKGGYNSQGYDLKGYDRFGFSFSGIHKRTGTYYDENDTNREGYDRQGYKFGYDRRGYSAYGRNRNGYSHLGYDEEGYDIMGYNFLGYGKSGFDKEGYDLAGYGQDGYNRAGKNRLGKVRGENLFWPF